MGTFIYLLKQFGRGIWSLANTLVLRMLLPFCAAVGIFVLVDICWLDKPVPIPRALLASERTQALLLAKQDSLPAWIRTSENAERWYKMRTALRLLDHSCPAVSAWVRKEWAEDRLVFQDSTPEYIAAFRWFNSKLYITEGFFNYGDYYRASILAHEYFHSQQTSTCRVMQLIADTLGRKELQYIEAPAYAYGDRVYTAISGNP